MFPVLLSRGLRVCLSAGVIGLLLAAGLYWHHVNTTSVALALVLLVFSIALLWGSIEALIAAFVAGLGLDYYLLPPRGFGLGEPQHWLSLLVFAATALVTGQLSARANRHRTEAIRRQQEIEQLYRITDTLWEGENAGAIVQKLGSSLREILGLEAVAVFEKDTGRVFRSGSGGEQITEEHLLEVAVSGNRFLDAGKHVAVEPVREGAQFWGSLGVAGAAVPVRLLKAIAERVGAAIGKAHAAERATAEALARRADELKAAIFDALAHEAKGPLASIAIAASALLAEPQGSAEQQRELLAVIKEEAQRLNRWIDEAARVSRTDARQIALDKSPRDVRDLVSRALEGLGSQASGRSIRLEIAESLPMALCDRGLIQKVLGLLLDNALKYSPAGSAVTISAHEDHEMEMIVVSVSDAGPGVPDEEKARIFERHYRGARHRESVPGMGVGLASARYLVESHGGEIWVTDRPGGGATFHFTLPAAIRARV